MAIGGDIIEVSYNNPEVGEGIWYPKSDEDSTFDPGGIRNADDANMISGSGSAIEKKNRVRWSFETTYEWDANGQDELEVARQLSESTAPTTWTLTSINGMVWQGVGSVVGDLNGSGNNATLPIKVAGGGRLRKI